MTIEKATKDDLPEMQRIFSIAREFMRNNANPTQWGDSRPPLFLIERDLKNGASYLIKDGQKVVGTFSYYIGDEPTYRVIDGAWLRDAPYGTIHRIASSGEAKGVFETALSFCASFGADIRIDTHFANRPMLHLMDKYGFVYCGEIVIDDGTKRKAFQKIIGE